MTRRKGKRKNLAQSSSALRRNGQRAFEGGDYGRAIDAWERVGQQTPQMRPTLALAEAYFRRGLNRLCGRSPAPEAGLSDLQRAADLLSGDPCYVYHLGLAAHRQGELDRAIRAYRVVRQAETEFAARAAYPLALALCQRGEDVSTVEWDALSAEEQAMLSQARAFRRRPYTLSPDAPLLWRGLAALDAGEREQAQTLLQEALASSASCADPEHRVQEGVAHYYLGVLAAQAEDWDEVGRRWSAARAAGFESPWLEANLGELYHRMAEDRLRAGDVEGALDAAIEATRHKSGDKQLAELFSQAYQRLAYRAASAGDWDEALDRWEDASEVGGSSFRLAYNRALSYERAEDYVAAGDAWREALRRRPRRADHPDAISDEQVARLWRRAAEAYHKAGDYEEVANVYRQALKWNPDDLDTRMALAEGLTNDGRLQAAENELNRVLERDPDHIPALLRLGEVISELDRWWQRKDALRCWERVLELDPRNADAIESLADFYTEEAENMLYWGILPTAIEMYQKALGYQPKNGRILASLGRCHLKMGDLDTAHSYIEEALSKAPEDLNGYSEVIQAWLDQGEAEQAWQVVARAEASIASIPYTFYVALAAYCIQSEYHDLAQPWLDRAVEKAPPDQPVFTMIGEMAVMYGDHEIGREYLERAICAGQQVGQAYLMLGILAAKEADLDEANRQWDRAERVARSTRDPDLKERIEVARSMFSPQGILNWLMRHPFADAPRSMGPPLGGFPFDLFDEDEDDDDEFFDFER